MGVRNWIGEHRFRNDFMYYMNRIVYEVWVFFRFRIRSDRAILTKKYERIFGYRPDLTNPCTLTEKIQWLKLHDRKDFYTTCADKYAVRSYLEEQFGSEYLIPLIFHTSDWRQITPENIGRFPCIVKANHTSGDYVILRDAEHVDWPTLRRKCRWWLHKDYYATSQEWQYKNIERQIVVEELLRTGAGKIPNDYKLHFIDGVLQFVYVSIDREGANKRNIYDADWAPLGFSWVEKASHDVRGAEIDMPASFGKMKEIGARIARNFRYVRVDFYDVDGKLYFGEITLYHGSGFDVFSPAEFDLKYGELLKIDA